MIKDDGCKFVELVKLAPALVLEPIIEFVEEGMLAVLDAEEVLLTLVTATFPLLLPYMEETEEFPMLP